MLLHAKRHWPEAITTILWTYDIKAEGARHNSFHLNNSGIFPFQLFSGVETTFDLKLKHTWGCLDYIMDAKLQGGYGGIIKWESRSRHVIYLGYSPVCNGSAAMVLNPKIGHVFPQYHIVLDDGLTTVPYKRAEAIPPNILGYAPRMVVPCPE